MYTNVYLKTSKIDSCTPKVVFIIFMVRALVSCKIRTTLLIPYYYNTYMFKPNQHIYKFLENLI